jgi:hypothetical protein
MPGLHTLMTGLAFGESPRWHEDRLWFSDMGAGEVIAIDLDGTSEIIARIPAMPMGSGWLPDGRMLIVSSRNGLLLRIEPGGSLVTHADLTGLVGHPWSDLAVDGRGNAYIGNIGFDFGRGEPVPGTVALVTPDGSARQVADGILFPNGIVVTPDNSTLIMPSPTATGSPPSTSRPTAACPAGGCGPTSATGSPTASASTPTAPSGTPKSPASAACASARAANCCRSSSSTAAASPARSAAQAGERCS